MRNPVSIFVGAVTRALVEHIACVCHEANRAHCLGLGDTSQPAWADAPAWQRESAINGVMFALSNPNAGPSASHDNWSAQKIAEGWKWGETKDPEAKTHPCLVPFEQLPIEQQVKDRLFQAIVRAFAASTNAGKPSNPAVMVGAPADMETLEKLRNAGPGGIVEVSPKAELAWMKIGADEAAVEKAIQDKGLNAPRLTPAQIDSVIVADDYYVVPGTAMTVCTLTLRNGYNVVGTSAAASPENFDREIGRSIARKNAREQIWALEGYLLKQRLFENSIGQAPNALPSGAA